MDCRGRDDEQSLTVAIPLRYSTIYTMFPVFSLVLDKDVKSEVAMLYPELYKDLLKVLQPSPTSTPLPSTSPFFSPFISHLLLLSDGAQGMEASSFGGKEGELCLPLEVEGGRASADCKQKWFLRSHWSALHPRAVLLQEP